MNIREQFGFYLFMLLYNVGLYYLFDSGLIFVAILVNSFILLLLSYISLSYNESVLDILEQIKSEKKIK